MQSGEAKCSWCGLDLQSRRGGSPQRFCSTEHRSLFWSTLRRWGARAVAAGILTIADIRNGDPAACTLPGAPVSPPPVPGGGAGTGLALRRFRTAARRDGRDTWGTDNRAADPVTLARARSAEGSRRGRAWPLSLCRARAQHDAQWAALGWLASTGACLNLTPVCCSAAISEN